MVNQFRAYFAKVRQYGNGNSKIPRKHHANLNFLSRKMLKKFQTLREGNTRNQCSK